jgi:hypothetical protein
VNDNHVYLNAAAEKRPKFSVELFQENGSIAQRQFGARLRNVYSFRQDNQTYMHIRELEGRKLLVLLNFSSKKRLSKQITAYI